MASITATPEAYGRKKMNSNIAIKNSAAVALELDSRNAPATKATKATIQATVSASALTLRPINTRTANVKQKATSKNTHTVESSHQSKEPEKLPPAYTTAIQPNPTPANASTTAINLSTMCVAGRAEVFIYYDNIICTRSRWYLFDSSLPMP